MTAKTHYNIKLIRAAALAPIPSEIIAETVAETIPATRRDTGQIEPETPPRWRWPCLPSIHPIRHKKLFEQKLQKILKKGLTNKKNYDIMQTQRKSKKQNLQDNTKK